MSDQMPKLSARPVTTKALKWWQIIAVLVLMFWFAGLAYGAGYIGRTNLRTSQYENCVHQAERNGKVALSWRAQANADQIVADDKFQSGKTRVARAAAAAQHRKTATLLENASLIDCSDAVPKVRLFPIP